MGGQEDGSGASQPAARARLGEKDGLLAGTRWNGFIAHKILLLMKG
jgi:hypothetical protein